MTHVLEYLGDETPEQRDSEIAAGEAGLKYESSCVM